jgi:class 3 adenylate cyclase
MPLTAGKQLGAFEIIELLGSGGMGEVYRARDTKLGRQVAIKILGVLAEADETQVTRFEREARFLASLDHPNIAGIYDFQEQDGTKFLIMQLVEGPTLGEQLKLGPLPLREALLIFAQIAEALDAAHHRDIVHRDLKPANLKITPDARVKVLDFGLAKFSAPEAISADVESLTLGLEEIGATQSGQILGTPAYMSPEQARGLNVDKRADIWSFGCIFYETLVGQRPFQGGTVADLVSNVLRAEPDWEALPRETPANIRGLLQRCLEKDREARLADIGDARLEIDRALTALSVGGELSVAALGEADAPNESVLKVMLFTEIVDPVELKRRLGDRAGAALIGRHDQLFRQCLSRSRGTEVDNAGDGFFCVFDRAADALSCAIAFQHELQGLEGREGLEVRIGIHMGEIVRLSRASATGAVRRSMSGWPSTRRPGSRAWARRVRFC